jgi:hypothetical protein
MQKGKSNKESFFSHCVHEKSLSRRKSRNRKRERKKGEIYLKADAEKNMRWKFKLRIVI